MKQRQIFIFWTLFDGEASNWLGSEMLRGRLRQGWGLEGMSLIDQRGHPLEVEIWERRYRRLARSAGWDAKTLTKPRIANRHKILLGMLAIEPGDLLVIPRKPNPDEVAFALATKRYRFEMAGGYKDFGHVVGIATDSLRVAAYHSPELAGLVSSFANYRSAITPVRKEERADLIRAAYEHLGGRAKQKAMTNIERQSDEDNTVPNRVLTAIQRIVRDTVAGRALKALYGHRCQLCGTGVQVPRGGAPYVEVHHLIPLGRPACGNDDWNNMVVVCPNCHAAFDNGAYRIEPTTLLIRTPDGERKIKFAKGHHLNPKNVRRHWRLGL